MGNRRFTLEQIRRKLRATGSNLVFLQEVIGENERHRQTIDGWPDTNQLEYLADTVWSHYAYGKNAIYQHGHHGNAILSELPFSKSNNVDVSTLSFSQRGILHGMLEQNIHLLCIHLGLFEQERKEQVKRLIDYINNTISDDAPLILAGDFNDWRKTAHYQIKKECQLIEVCETHQNRVATTYPAFMPMLPMDRIYVRGFDVNSISVMSHSSWRQLSDHCAVIAELSLKGPA